ncbi:hypothetical protein MPSEU_000937600 [Mayamaea pseudoterrestris]|nr:hypothetical protein MPSEU_000937600 [Mayamaea pseudoterrestris]
MIKLASLTLFVLVTIQRGQAFCLVASSQGLFLRQSTKLSARFGVSHDADDTNADKESRPWMAQGLLLSSFSDGLRPNPTAQAFVQQGLILALLTQEQHRLEQRIKDTVKFSPCAGPDMSAVEQLEFVDDALEQLQQNKGATSPLDLLRQYQKDYISNDNESSSLILRFVYIPTAMYALRLDSTNSPGKQRQRARADGKSRRNDIVNLLQELLPSIDIHVVTIDWDDGSIKQPQATGGIHAAASAFPQTAHDAMRTWQPHLVYVQGGNTFWLHHCLHKTIGYKQDLLDFCTSKSGMYIGSSAGAILVGARMETACWKGWDDPRVVLGMESYEDWKGTPGLSLVGQYSFFPHMDDQWNELVNDKSASLAPSTPICLRDSEVCQVTGATKSATILCSAKDIHAIALNS